MTELFIITGEQSGDMHAAELLSVLKKDIPHLKATGVVGPCLREQGVEEIVPAEDLAVMGFSDVFKALPRLLKIFYKVRNAILAKQPQAVLMVDATSFNLRMARALRKKGYQGKLIQFVSPSVWAWGSHRKKIMADTLDLLMTIYPFENQYFNDTDLRVEYVGHPLIEKLANYTPNPHWRQKANIPQDVPLISLFPGSRKGEIQRNLPLMLEAIKQMPLQEYHIAVSAANPVAKTLIDQLLVDSQVPAHAVPVQMAHYELMADSKAAIAKSGTVTLELALFSCPTVVSYKLTQLNKWMAQYVLKLNLPHYCIVNILAGKTVFPEYIANQPDPQNLSNALMKLLSDEESTRQAQQGCNEVKQLLTASKTSEKAACLVKEALQ